MTMTGKEKLQAVIDVIGKTHESLIRGNEVRVRSSDFKDIEVNEQKIALDVLANELHCITYTESKEFENEEDLDPQTIGEIAEISHMTDLPQEHFIAEALAQRNYTIEILKGFNALYRNSETKITPQDEQDLLDKSGPHQKKVINPVKRITVHQLEPEHYNKRTGVLHLSPTDKVLISKSGSARSKDGKKFDQCWLLECVFKDVNTLRNGVKISKVLGINSHLINKKREKKIRNLVQEINGKVAEVGGPKSLVRTQNQKVFVNNSYLL